MSTNRSRCEPTVSSVRPLVTVLDPLTWSHDWSYEVEETRLAERGIEFVVAQDRDHRDELVRTADVIVSSGLVAIDARLMSTFERCVGILCYSSGRDAVDLDAAEKAGIEVANVKANTIDVVEHAMALIFALRRLTIGMAAAAERGDWDLRDFPEVWKIERLHGQTLGIVGAGSVGRELAIRCRALGMRTIATYHTPPSPPNPDLPHVAIEELAATSDVIAVCASLNADSDKMIDADVLAHVKPGAILVNVSRGKLVDEAALVAALDSGALAGAALDVRDPEPPETPDLLAGRPNVIQTPHMAGASAQARADLHELAARQIIRLLERAGTLDTHEHTRKEAP